MTNPTPCGVGYYSAASATVCIICPVGTYCSAAVTTTPTSCGNGFLCTTTGMGAAPFHISINSCLPGYWCASNVATACPVGTYQPQYGASASTACITTPEGFYTNVVASTSFFQNKCPAGMYCPAGRTSGNGYDVSVALTNAIICPSSTFRSYTMGQSVADCGSCPAGFYCGPQTSVPALCPRGFYCPALSISPTACPVGTFGAGQGLT